MKTKNDFSSAGPAMVASPQWLELVRSRVSGLRFGVVQIVVHEGRVTQVESTERFRLPAEPTASEG
jgi:hypothetical protein